MGSREGQPPALYRLFDTSTTKTARSGAGQHLRTAGGPNCLITRQLTPSHQVSKGNQSSLPREHFTHAPCVSQSPPYSSSPPDVHPRSSKRPLRTPPHPNPPAMAFSTTQRAEFIPWELGQRTKPHVREAYQCPQEPFQSQSLYRLHFPPREPVMTTLRQPLTPRQPNSSGFPHTTTMESYKGWRAERPACYGEPPALAGALLSPDQAAEIESTMQREFTEKRIPKPELVKGAQVQLTIEGDHDMMTTHQSTYQSVPLEKRVAQSHNKGIVPAGKRAQVEYMTKYQSDFPACSLLPARLQPAQPPLDNLAINQGFSTDFQTVQRESYHGWDTRRYPCASPIKLKEELADLRKERDGKFSGDTVTKLSYPPLPLDRPPRTIEWPPTVLRSLYAKFDDSTAHKFFFREWGVQPRIRQGDPYDGVYIRPLAKFESQTTTHSTFLPQIAEVVKNCKPEQKSIRAQGKQDFSTIHRESYRPIPLPVCRLQMYLIQQQQKGQETINSLVPVKA
ncbi:stabilizer of axonemal microtubules 2-like isoform X1 [Gopherus evgoodei]|uniref:stabilizer of axonemal microtubules 2-like isoform X1 n=1 Tax=Gopherus evgoodei TaxID=1825980 RepID=UPI0011CF7CB1|nr:stabilizer of axonemal microtubules 2-like isoform X1 [Gopherus evgoodei]